METDELKYCRKFSTILILTVFGDDIAKVLARLEEAPILPENYLLDLDVIQVPNVERLYRYNTESSSEMTEDGEVKFVTFTLEYFRPEVFAKAKAEFAALKGEA